MVMTKDSIIGEAFAYAGPKLCAISEIVYETGKGLEKAKDIMNQTIDASQTPVAISRNERVFFIVADAEKLKTDEKYLESFIVKAIAMGTAYIF